MTFDSLGLKPTLLQAVADTGYTTPTPIQLQAIPAVLSGRDIMAAAQTGTGKTAGFTLPLLQRLGGKEPVRSNHTRALVLTPTRELAAQIQESITEYGKHESLSSVVVFGGVNINPQQKALRRGCDILVATPGRLLDLFQQNAVKFTDIEILVLDEADRMLDMGFIRDIRKILNLLPKKRQNLMFSATFSPEIRELAKTICHNALEIDVAPRNSTVNTITQQIYPVKKEHKLPLLGKLLTETSEQVLVFSRTKHGANNLVKKLARFQVKAAAIHGNKSQAQRTKALADFKANQVQVLVATDIAARGIDIDQLAMVINFDLPQVAEDYVHRIGRTGRAGASGLAVSLVADDEGRQLRDIERLIKMKIDRQTYNLADLPQPSIDAEADAEEARENQRRATGGRQGQGGRGRSSAGQSRGTAKGRSSSQSRSSSQGRSSAPGRSAAQPRTTSYGRSPSPSRDIALNPDALAQRSGNTLTAVDKPVSRAPSRTRSDGSRSDSRSAARSDSRTSSRGSHAASGPRKPRKPVNGNRISQDRPAVASSHAGGSSFWNSVKQGIDSLKVFGK